jgi:molecular chaperone DnaJ
MELTFEQAVFGFATEIEIPKLVPCEVCHGSGAKSPSDRVTCKTCQGTGQIRIQQGFFQMATTCHTCGGTGEVIKNPCPNCSGRGRVQKTKKLLVNIPAGINNENRIRLAGEGEAGTGGAPSGDLFVVVHVKPHELFVRQEQDLLCEIPISFAQAALGTDLDVPTLEGLASLTIPAGTQSGQLFRLKNKGVQQVGRNIRGNLLVKVIVEVPKSLNRNQKETLSHLESQMEASNQPDKEKFQQKVKRVISKVKG